MPYIQGMEKTFSGKRLQGEREKRKLSRADLGYLANISERTVSNYETGASKPDVDTLERISSALGRRSSVFSEEARTL